MNSFTPFKVTLSSQNSYFWKYFRLRNMQLQHNYQVLLDNIAKTWQSGQINTVRAARQHMLLTYWAIGQHIVEFEQQGNEKAGYGSKILERLSNDLSDQLGRGFSRTNLISCVYVICVIRLSHFCLTN
jgi:DUF1016 N-terminal domain